MNISIVRKEQCTGCTACQTVCPIGCITFQPDTEGFLYPKVDEKVCLDCQACTTACPAIHQIALYQPLHAMAASGKDESLVWNSASGGAFYLLARYILSQDGYVCGAVLDKNLKLCHVLSNRVDEIEAMRGSKYIQSDLKECFKKIAQLVKEGRTVLFSGTPCQVAGLRNVVKIGKENLYTIDLICHGTPSAGAFANYMHKMYGHADFPNFAFRKKDKHLFMDYAFSWDGTEKRVASSDDPFYQAFMNGDNYRMSCYQCHTHVKNELEISLLEIVRMHGHIRRWMANRYQPFSSILKRASFFGRKYRPILNTSKQIIRVRFEQMVSLITRQA